MSASFNPPVAGDGPSIFSSSKIIAYMQSQILLDSRTRIYTNSTEFVSGRVVLTPQPGKKSSATEVFGPLQVSLRFQGRAEVEVQEGMGRYERTYPASARLFYKEYQIHQGSMRIAMGEPYSIPFSITFPARTSRGAAGCDARKLFADGSHPLPPSGIFSSRDIHALVSYKISATLFMPGLQSKVKLTDPYEVGVHYCPATARSDGEFSRMVPFRAGFASRADARLTVQNLELLPLHARPKGMKAQTKALLTSGKQPKFIFDAVLTINECFHPGGSPRVTIHFQPQTAVEGYSCPSVPDIELIKFTLKVKASTNVRTSESSDHGHTDAAEHTIYQSEQKPEPSRICDASNGHKLTFVTKPLPTNLPPTFRTYLINRSYRAHGTVTLRCAGKKFEVECIRTVGMKPLPVGPSTAHAEVMGVSEQLPAYEYREFTELLEEGPPTALDFNEQDTSTARLSSDPSPEPVETLPAQAVSELPAELPPRNGKAPAYELPA